MVHNSRINLKGSAMSNELAAIEQNFWQDLQDVSREVDRWPEWKKSYRIDIYSAPIPEKALAPSTQDLEKTRE